MPPRRKRRGLELGLILLLNELLQFGMRNIPPLTLGTILGQTLVYVGAIDVPWERACISGTHIFKEGDWKRLFLSVIQHADDMHLYFNMASFLIKGRCLEKRYGSKNFTLILLFLIIVSSIMYVTLAQVMSNIMENDKYMDSCAIGFSGVVFALKVLTTHEEPYIRAMLLGIEIPGKYAAWVELIVIHMLVPNSSFLGHFAGILAGVIYCKSFVGGIVDKLTSLITGDPVIHGGDIIYVVPQEEYEPFAPPSDKIDCDDCKNSCRWNSSLFDDCDDSVDYSKYPQSYSYSGVTKLLSVYLTSS